ncbi:hypothetical protein ACHAXR_010521 [Thalassiosira sp. AJA248-18]
MISWWFELVVFKISQHIRSIDPSRFRPSVQLIPSKVKVKDDIYTGGMLVQRDDARPETLLVRYCEDKGVIQTFRGTMSDVIYPDVKGWLDDQLFDY